jgi:hypothetical protein
MDNTFLKMSSKNAPRFFSYQILLDTAHSFPKLQKMLKLNTLSLKSFLGASLTNFQITLFIGKELMDQKYLRIFHLRILMYLMVLLEKYFTMLRKTMTKAEPIVLSFCLVMEMEAVVPNYLMLRDLQE